MIYIKRNNIKKGFSRKLIRNKIINGDFYYITMKLWELIQTLLYEYNYAYIYIYVFYNNNMHINQISLLHYHQYYNIFPYF